MNLKKIHHVAIIVSDYKESREFYVEKLGFRVIRENYRPEREDYKLDLELDGCELEIFSGKGNPPRVNYPEACGLRHHMEWKYVIMMCHHPLLTNLIITVIYFQTEEP